MSLPTDLSQLRGIEPAELGVLEKQLTCPICLQIFNKPVVILPCQHNLCRKCANELYQPSLFQARTTMIINSGRFRCPTCHFDVVLDRHGVYGLPRNLLVENIIDIYKEEVSNTERIPTPTSLLQASPGLTCSDHEGEKLNIFCVTCQVPTCSLCKVFGAHQSCQVAPLTDVHQLQKDELRKEINSLKLISVRAQTLVDEVEDSCRSIEDNCNAQKQMVSDQFDRMRSILEEKRKVMMQQISSEEEEKTGSSRVLMRRYGDHTAANCRLIEQARGSMEESDEAGFVQKSGELITQLISAANDCRAQTPEPSVENLSLFTYNFCSQERALRSLDFIKDEEENSAEESEDESHPAEAEGPSEQEGEIKTIPHTCVAEQMMMKAEPAEPPEPVTGPSSPSLARECEEVLEDETHTETDDLLDMSLETVDHTVGKKEDEGEHVTSEVEEKVEECAAKTRIILDKEEQGMSTQQAVALAFYLLGFLLILQRVWAYTGFFICI